MDFSESCVSGGVRSAQRKTPTGAGASSKPIHARRAHVHYIPPQNFKEPSYRLAPGVNQAAIKRRIVLRARLGDISADSAYRQINKLGLREV